MAIAFKKKPDGLARSIAKQNMKPIVKALETKDRWMAEID
jgi:hypothetical protein